MKIIHLEAENFKRLRAVSITPTNSTVQITGANGSGKSSVLDAIYAALVGREAIPDVPVRVGEQSARITLDLGTLKVTRRFTASGSTLIVESVDGARFPSPQAMLDKLLGALTFDPLEFTRMKPAEQRAALGKLVGVDAELRQLDAQRRTAFENRTMQNKLVMKLAARVNAIPQEIPVEAVDVGALLRQIEDIEHANALLRLEAADRAEAERELTETEARIAERQAQIAKLQQDVTRLTAAAADLRTQRERWEPLVYQDVTPLKQQIADAQETNARAAEHIQRAKLLAEHDAEMEKATQLSEEIARIDHEKAMLVAQAPMPIAGLAFDEDYVIYRGVPFAQASGAEQLRVSLAIAMAANPQLRVLRIKDGSLLDERSLAIVQEMVRDQDYQLWIERVDTRGTVGVVMQDGEVVPDPFAEVPELSAVGGSGV